MSVDRGRAAVAAVEDAAFGGTDADAPIDRSALVRRLEAVIEGPWWRACGPPVSVTTPRRSTRSSSARTTSPTSEVEIRLADGQLTVATLAHELAHALAGVADGHGEGFRGAHVDVVAVMCGEPTAAHLRSAYRAFDLTVARRRWPAPWRAEGATFRVVT